MNKTELKKWAQIIGLIVGGAVAGIGGGRVVDDTPDQSKQISEHETRITRLEARSDSYESDAKELRADVRIVQTDIKQILMLLQQR